jgi:Uma2 family endonuclease
MALCGLPGHGDRHEEVLTNPALIVEVLSRSTEAYDRGDKFMRYKAIETLREYVLISQDEVLVEHFAREGDFWNRTAIADLDAVIEFRSVACAFPMREIYRRTAFVVEDAPAVPE